MFSTDSVTLQLLADVLQQEVAQLAAHWPRLNVKGHAWAYNLIVYALTSRGYTLAQVTDWDQGEDYEADLTLWWCLSRKGGTQNIEKKFIDTMDRREELKCLMLTINGVATDPLGTAGLPAAGAFDTTGDLFVLDTEDSRLGEITQW